MKTQSDLAIAERLKKVRDYFTKLQSDPDTEKAYLGIAISALFDARDSLYTLDRVRQSATDELSSQIVDLRNKAR